MTPCFLTTAPDAMPACFLIQQPERPTIHIAYVCVAQGQHTEHYARHFIQTYRAYPAGIDHCLTVIANGGRPMPNVMKVLESAGFGVITRSNDGWDIGAYLEMADYVDPDLLVCLGESVYFHRSGWLLKLAEAWREHGEGIYGCYASFLVRAHLNTTAFACSPKYLRQYPFASTRADRYQFEHGPQCLWRRIDHQGGAAKLVTWDGVWDQPDWRTPDDILWRGNQSNCLVWCNHTDRYFSATEATKRNWEQGADGLNPGWSTQGQAVLAKR